MCGVWKAAVVEVAAARRLACITADLPCPVLAVDEAIRPVAAGGWWVWVTWSTWASSWLTDGVIRSSTGLGYTPRKTMMTMSGTMISRSLQPRSRSSRSRRSGSPWKTCWYPQQVHRGEHDAEVAAIAHHRWARKVPDRTRNSPTKPFRPGSPMEAMTKTVKTPAITGAGHCSPRSWFTCHVLRRS